MNAVIASVTKQSGNGRIRGGNMRGIAFLLFLSFHLSLPSPAASCKDSLSKESIARVALVQYELSRPSSIEAWERRIYQYVLEAVEGRASYVFFPELISIEGMPFFDRNGLDQASLIRRVARELTPYFFRKFSEWSRRHSITIFAGTWPLFDSHGEIHNAAPVFGPSGVRIHTQPKNHLTQYEREFYQLDGSRSGCRVFSLSNGIDTAIAVCFDSEFPNYLPATVGTIPELIFVPSMTGTEAGRHRVLRSSSARAVEYHAYVLVTGTVGGDPNDPIIGSSMGQAYALSPSDRRFPSDGILAAGIHNTRHILFVNLDLDVLRISRQESTTFPAQTLHNESR